MTHHMDGRLASCFFIAPDKTVRGNVSDIKIALHNILQPIMDSTVHNTYSRPTTQTVLREGGNLNVICKAVSQYSAVVQLG